MRPAAVLNISPTVLCGIKPTICAASADIRFRATSATSTVILKPFSYRPRVGFFRSGFSIVGPAGSIPAMPRLANSSRSARLSAVFPNCWPTYRTTSSASC